MTSNPTPDCFAPCRVLCFLVGVGSSNELFAASTRLVVLCQGFRKFAARYSAEQFSQS